MLRLGVDLGGTKTEGIVMDAAGTILARERRPTPQQRGYPAILQTIHDLIGGLETKVGEHCHVGIGTPGALSPRTGLLKNSNTVALNGRPLKTDLEELLARPVRLANDANCFTLSEAIDGAAKDRAVVFGVIVGTGVGGGIALHGRVHEGVQRIAGEWGHNILEPDGPRCYCGRNGCVETFLSGPGLTHDYRTHGGDADRDAVTIVERAAAGEALAEAAVQRYLERFGRALAGVINILDPDAVVLGGGLSNVKRLYSEGRERVAHYVFSAQGDRTSATVNDEFRTPILPNVHGDSSGVRGAARLWDANE